MATHGTTRATPHTNIFNMAAIVMDDILSDPPLGGGSGNISPNPPRSGYINDKKFMMILAAGRTDPLLSKTHSLYNSKMPSR